MSMKLYATPGSAAGQQVVHGVSAPRTASPARPPVPAVSGGRILVTLAITAELNWSLPVTLTSWPAPPAEEAGRSWERQRPGVSRM